MTDKSTAHEPNDRSAAICAALLTTLHFLANIVVFGWYYFLAPRWKRELNDVGMEVGRTARHLIQQSDWIVNFWYMLVVLVPVALFVDFVLLKWMAKRWGVSRTVVFGVVVAGLILLQAVFAHFTFSTELLQLRGLGARDW